MEISFQTLVLLPVGLGLLGFIEPCTIGGHLLFLLPLLAGFVAALFGLTVVFTVSMIAAILQSFFLMQIDKRTESQI